MLNEILNAVFRQMTEQQRVEAAQFLAIYSASILSMYKSKQETSEYFYSIADKLV